MPPIKPSTISVLLRVATPVTKAPSPSRIMPIFSGGVIGQQALNVMLHQRIQSADKGGDHPQRQQHHAHHSGGTPPASETVSMPYRPTFITTVENSAAAGALAPA